MKTAYHGLYIGRTKNFIAFLVGAKLCGLCAAAVLIHDYVSKRGVIRADNAPYDPDFKTFQQGFQQKPKRKP